MARASLHPYGRRLYKGASLPTIKAIEILPPYGGFWADIWNTNYGSGAFLAGQVAQCAKLGANTVKIGMFPYNEAESGHTFPAEATYRTRRQAFFQTCRSLNLGVIVNIGNEPAQLFGSSDTLGATQIPAMAALAATIEQDAGDLIVYLDICDEINDGGVSGWKGGNTSVNAQQAADMSMLFDTIRAATTLPLSASVAVQSPSALATSTYIDLQYALGCDFHDVHLYYTGGVFPQGSDMAYLEGRSKYLGRYLIGEMGESLSAGQAAQTAWFNGIGDTMRRPQSMGAVMFGLTDFGSAGSGDFGIYAASDTTFANPRLGMTIPFSNWPG